MASAVERKAKKDAALEHLKFNRRPSNPSNAQASSSLTGGSMSSSSSLPPPQSRDATVSSRFFAPSTPSQSETILAPNSSPMPSPYQPFRPGHGGDVAHVVLGGLFSMAPRPPPNRAAGLGAPTTFTSNRLAIPSQFQAQRRPRDDDDVHDGPPHKRIASSSRSFHEPESPGIRRAGQRTRPVASRDAESDDSFSEASTADDAQLSRLVRANAVSWSGSDLFADSNFTKFKMTMPMESQHRIKAAWTYAGGDFTRATKLLSDANWTPPPPPKPLSNMSASSSAAASPVKIIGRVDGYDEASRAQREAAREKGKQSAIYAHQVKHMATPISKPVSRPLSQTPSMDTPLTRPIRRKRPKKMVINSDSEVEISDSDEERSRKKRRGSDDDEDDEDVRTLTFFNTKPAASIQELTGCTPGQATAILELRPFNNVDDLNAKLGQGRKKAGPSGISPRLFEDATAILQGYGAVDRVLEECEQTGAELRSIISSWTAGATKSKEDATEPDGALNLASLEGLKTQKSQDYLVAQPSLIADGIQLKDYQLIGVNWLRLLYNKKLSCILADEMGLGKTIQVISFFAYLKEKGRNGPHLIVVPSSTLENWCREFSRFAPSINVKTYYGSKDDRAYLRHHLLETLPQNGSEDGWNVLITTYNLAQGDGDRKFFRKIEWESCVFDEGHVLKNFQSQRYQALLKVESKWRLLLTGTPLQNNLQELVSLMNFILPDQFSESMPELRAIFKTKGDSKVTLLAQERVSRAKKMMTPFVLRRRKDQVLSELPKKHERLEWCDMTSLQKSIYRDTMKRSRKTVLVEEIKNDNAKSRAKKPKTKDKQYLENTTNVLMDLRKAASHPMLFRKLYTDDALSGIAKLLLKEPDFQRRGALFDHVKEDMTVMTDAELQLFCGTYKSTRKYLQDNECYLNSGKVQTLLKLLDVYQGEGRKILIFSQFTQILDILKAILEQKDIRYLILTGSTAVDVRQSLCDEFTEDEDIPVFLLSTKAGGMGINLTAASVVIMFDQDFNPHNDRQATDRAYRIGQKRDVDVVKLISRGTIEEDMFRLGETKLALDEAVAGEEGDDAPEREMKTSLMSSLRQQFEKEGSEESDT